MSERNVGATETQPDCTIDRRRYAAKRWRASSTRISLYSILPVMLLGGVLAGPAHAQGNLAREIDGGDVVRALPGLRHVLTLLESNEIVGRVLALPTAVTEGARSATTHRTLPRFGVVGAQEALSFRQAYGAPRRARPQLPALSIGTQEISVRRGDLRAKMVFSLHQEIVDTDIPKVRPLVVGGFEYRF